MQEEIETMGYALWYSINMQSCALQELMDDPHKVSKKQCIQTCIDRRRARRRNT